MLRTALWGLVALAAGAIGVGHLRAQARRPAHLLTVPGAANGVDAGVGLAGRRAPAFVLDGPSGHPVALSALRGRTIVLAFVDSRGETVDPLTAQTLLDAQRLLGGAAAGVRLVAVNANPGATAVGAVRAWSAGHGMLHRWLFLTGPAGSLRRVWREYAVGVAVLDGEVVHTPAVYVLAPGLREVWAYQTPSAPSDIPDQAYVLAEHVAGTLRSGVWPQSPATLARVSNVLGAPSGAASFRLPGIGVGGASTVITVGGGHGALVDFFATWCHACLQDLRVLNAYARIQHADPALPPLVAVDLRVAEPSTAYVRRFLSSHGVRFPVGLDGTGRVFDRFGVTALPSNVLVSADGRTLWSHVGVVPVRRLVALLRQAQRGAR